MSTEPQDVLKFERPPATGRSRRSWTAWIIYCAGCAALGAAVGSLGWRLHSLMRHSTESPEPADAVVAANHDDPDRDDHDDHAGHVDDQTPHDGQPDPSRPGPLHGDAPETLPARPGRPTTQELARAVALGEQYFLEGNATAAMRALEWVARFQDRTQDTLLHYRLGVCAESLGDYERALAEHGTAAATAIDETQGCLCQLGQARAWRSLNQNEMAIQILSRLWLTVDRDDRSRHLAGLTAYLLAEALASHSVQDRSLPLWHDAALLMPSWQFDLFHVPPGQPPQSETQLDLRPIPLAEGVRITEDNQENPEQSLIEARLPRIKLTQLVDTLARVAGCKLVWSGPAKQSASARTAELCLRRATVALCLDALLAPADLVWRHSGAEIRIATAGELDPSECQQLRQQAAQRALQHATLEFPDFPLAPPALVTLGNLTQRDGQFDDALRCYDQVLRQHPRSPVKADASFNRAKLLLALGRDEEALQSFWHVIDAGAGPVPGAVAYLYVGRMLLEAEEPRRAIAPLIRAAQWTRKSDVRAQAVLTLAAAYLLHDNPASANQVLLDYRADFASEPASGQAAFLSALARYRAAANPTRREPQATALLNAAAQADPAAFFGRFGWYLCGAAFEELQLPERAKDIYTRGLADNPKLPYREAMTFRLACAHAATGDRDAAQRLLSELANGGRPQWRREAGFRLGALQLEAGSPADALHTARTLLAQCTTQDEKVRALRLLGSIYQRLGDHASAALCFAGSNPDAETPHDASSP